MPKLTDSNEDRRKLARIARTGKLNISAQMAAQKIIVGKVVSTINGYDIVEHAVSFAIRHERGFDIGYKTTQEAAEKFAADIIPSHCEGDAMREWKPLTEEDRQTIDELDNLDRSFNTWESNFIESMIKIVDDSNAKISPKQREILQDMARKYLD